ncbi:MAG: hypothetical protein AMJ62_09805 [Myxococcales bacterium SG8_38]|nr:MAG: hypothetical protein AMJ62_09805 [Myxococcales bacterium SG8_38]
MISDSHTIEEDLLRQVERWTPAEAELWDRWRSSLTVEQRADVLPLQAVLTGLVAFRGREGRADDAPGTDFRPHLRALGIAYEWALELVAHLRGTGPSDRGAHPRRDGLGPPELSLRSLERSLTDALRVSERLLKLPIVDAGSFQASADLFLRDLGRNPYFCPPEPLEFSNVSDLVSADSVAPELASWKSASAKTTVLISFLTLLRAHRLLGIADRQILLGEDLCRAHVVIAAVRKELETWTRFVLVQGVETFADELEARLLSVDAGHIHESRAEIGRSSQELQRLREAVEALATGIHGKACAGLDPPVPGLEPVQSLALPAERMRNGIREVRAALRDAAKQLHRLGNPSPMERTKRVSEQVPKSVYSDIWGFRFILRAFIDKASVAAAAADDWNDAENLEFVREFVRHFRVFGPRLSRATDYAERDALIRTVSALSKRETINTETLGDAIRECESFAEHLDASLERMPRSRLAPFDKHAAAAGLRDYLAAARHRQASERAAAAAFGLLDPARTQTG